MYTDKELRAAAGIITRIARKNEVSESQIRTEIQRAIRCGRSSPDPAVRSRWATFSYAGAEPTAEEFILWASSLARRR